MPHYDRLIQSLGGVEWESDVNRNQLTLLRHQNGSLLGYSFDCWTSPNFWIEHVHPEDRPRLSMLVGEQFLSHPSTDCEYRMIGADGGIAWIRDIANTESDLNVPRPRRVILFDVTLAKQREQSSEERIRYLESQDQSNRVIQSALRTSERRLDAAQKMAHVAWWERDLITGRANRSSESYAIFGLPEGEGEDILTWDQQWRQRIHPDDLERTTKAYQLALEGKLRYDLEYRVVRPSGEIRFVHSHAEVSFDANGRPLRIFGTMQDITELRQTERELRASEARFRTLVDHAADAFFLLDAHGTVLDVNRMACESLGYSPESLLGRQPLDFDAAMSQSKVAELLARLTHGETLAFESEHRRSDGSVFPVDIRIRPFQNGGEQFSVALVRDITERKRLEEQFRQSQKMDAIGQLAGGVAHDFNNLLTVINGYSHLLTKELSLDDPRRDRVVEVLKAGERAATLTRQLLAFSRKQILEPKNVRFNQVLNDLAKFLRRMIGEDCELEVRLASNSDNVRIDPAQFEQAIINLALNARDAMPEGGKITLATSDYLQNDNSNPSIPSGSYVVISMSDTGIGMDEGTMSRIFEPFFTTKSPGKGTGLGLAMVYGFVKQSNGYVEADSQMGMGTTMRIFLPLAESEQIFQPIVEPSDSAIPSGTETILLVEDEDSVRILTRSILKSCGYEVLDARDGIEGLAIASHPSQKIDLLVTDLVMPRMGGRRLAEEILSSRPCTKILYMTGYTEEMILTPSDETSDMPFLQKPFTAIQLAHSVRSLLDAPCRKRSHTVERWS